MHGIEQHSEMQLLAQVCVGALLGVLVGIFFPIPPAVAMI